MKIVILIITLLCSGCTLAFSQLAFLGKWKDQEEGTKTLKFQQANDGFYYGIVVSSTDKKIPAGYLIFDKCQYEAHSNTFRGTMMPPDMQTKINITISLEGNNQMKVVAKKFFMTKTLIFNKINE